MRSRRAAPPTRRVPSSTVSDIDARLSTPVSDASVATASTLPVISDGAVDRRRQRRLERAALALARGDVDGRVERAQHHHHHHDQRQDLRQQVAAHLRARGAMPAAVTAIGRRRSPRSAAARRAPRSIRVARGASTPRASRRRRGGPRAAPAPPVGLSTAIAASTLGAGVDVGWRRRVGQRERLDAGVGRARRGARAARRRAAAGPLTATRAACASARVDAALPAPAPSPATPAGRPPAGTAPSPPACGDRAASRAAPCRRPAAPRAASRRRLRRAGRVDGARPGAGTPPPGWARRRPPRAARPASPRPAGARGAGGRSDRRAARPRPGSASRRPPPCRGRARRARSRAGSARRARRGRRSARRGPAPPDRAARRARSRAAGARRSTAPRSGGRRTASRSSARASAAMRASAAAAAQAVQAREVVEQLAPGQARVEAGGVGEEAEPPPHRQRIGRHVDAGDARAPARRRQDPRQDPQRGGLAGAVGAEQAVDLAGRDAEREIGDRRLGAEALDQRIDDDGRLRPCVAEDSASRGRASVSSRRARSRSRLPVNFERLTGCRADGRLACSSDRSVPVQVGAGRRPEGGVAQKPPASSYLT